MAMSRLHSLRRLHRNSGIPISPPGFFSSSGASPIRPHPIPEGCRSLMSMIGRPVHCSEEHESEMPLIGARFMSGAPAGARRVSLKVSMQSPGFIYEPYERPVPIPFWRRWFTRSGWRRTKEDVILEMKSAYAITRLKKVTGYSKKLFYQRAVMLYKEINTLMAKGDTTSLRKLVTEKMYSTLKNEIKRRESMWTSVYWELVEPVTSIRTLRARMIALDKDELDKAFVQLTLEILAKQRFEAYNSKGVVLSGDKTKEVLVRDIWIFERSLFHPGADWRLCGRITL